MKKRGYAASPILHKAGIAMVLLVAGCSAPRNATMVQKYPDVAPTSQPVSTAGLRLEASQIKPLYREMLAIDLDAAVRTALADNLDIRRARQQVEASRGRWESSVGGAFPALVPTNLFEHMQGTARTTEGRLERIGFSTFQPAVAIQWIINPGQVAYEILAARKELSASQHQEQAVVIETLRQTAVQYYELVLSQTRIATARQAVTEAEELLRINRLHERTGTGVPADVLRTEAQLATSEQDLVLALDNFYQASVALAVTLRLDPSITLVPRIGNLPAITLIRPDLSLDDLLELAVAYRPDLKSVRTLVQAAAARRGATWWGAFGPQFQVGYQVGGITGHAEDVVPPKGIPNNLIVNPLSPTGVFASNPVINGAVKEGILRVSQHATPAQDRTYAFTDSERFNANAGWKFSLSAFGDLKTAGAAERQAIIEAERRLDQVRAQVVTVRESSRTHDRLISLAERQVRAAEEALRLTQTNLQVGTMTTLDVLQAEDAATEARLRYAQAVVRYNQAQINLTAALGVLEVDTFQPYHGPIAKTP